MEHVPTSTWRGLVDSVGVAPMNRDSGRQRGKRTTKAGRGDIRRVLYMATLTARRCNPVIRAFGLRLEAAAPRGRFPLDGRHNCLAVPARIHHSVS